MQASMGELVLYFTLYSVLGWICESIWCSIGTRKLVNRGFLNGPYCPVYGFGALLILFVCMPVKAYPVLVFVMAMVAASLLEYFTGWLLETLFHTRWWDYSHRKFNIRGRVCLRNTLLFGLLGLFATYIMHPPVERFVHSIPLTTQRIAIAVILCIFAIDLAHTLFTLAGLRKRLQALHGEVSTLVQYNERYSWLNPVDLHGSIEALRAICAQDKDDENAQAILYRLDELVSRKNAASRIIKAFPSLRHKDLAEELRTIKASIEEKRRKK